ncbi:peroxisomal NADH pyrophosphatase NUDT12-like isoform X2 [Anneissia japonica]|nr:peroxisomal NADH pyrophosphatase NUDT12-like isoform X2 [Anneissia japonica]XP_033113480.1 peroxisomal NADH pyrophosphatase NUDT12-like isoform X2 [Anneissia japonica]
MAGGTPMYGLMNELHDSASKGQVELVLKLIGTGKHNTLLNAQNEQGWTALMFAARNGQTDVAEALVQKGCDVSLMTKSGQTALEIAKFWNHDSIVNIISGKSNASTQLGQLPSVEVNFFGINPLDRCAALRIKQDWIEEQMHQPTTRFILFHKLNPLVVCRDNIYEICPIFYKDISFMFDVEPKPIYVFLGLGNLDKSEKNDGRIAWFALDVSSLQEEKVSEFRKDAEILSSKNRYAIMTIDEMQAGAIAQSKSLLTWHHRYKFCPTCGSITDCAEAGYKRICTNKDCISLQGVNNTSYPRLDPVVIMLVISPDKQKCLLGRQKQFPPGMFSCLAGFMEPGETIEDAVRREVMEESGVKVELVQYHSCQPWPMPMQLMIGCLAYATSSHIQVDQDELESACWFPKKQVAEILSGSKTSSGEGLFIPPKQAIAHQLIKAWVGMSANL